MNGTRKHSIDRFWARVEKSPGCWNWTGRKNAQGYGTVYFDGKQRRAHRVAYELAIGSIPVGLTLDHLCRNPSCVKPRHLEPVTNAENASRAAPFRPFLDTCARGHEYGDDAPLNTAGARICRTCRAQRARVATSRTTDERCHICGAVILRRSMLVHFRNWHTVDAYVQQKNLRNDHKKAASDE